MKDNNTAGNRIACRKDWKNLPMPQQCETFVLNRSFNEEEMMMLHKGNVPQSMEDKWFWFVEDNVLYAHRSWTGYCVYIIEFKDDDNHLVTVNRDPEQYGCTSIEEDKENLNELLDWWTEIPYDYYNEWLSETHDMLRKDNEEDKKEM